MAADEKLLPPGHASGATGNATPQPVAPGQAGGQTGNAAAAVPAAKSVASYGGRASGRKSEFKFPADSTEGKEERRLADNARKQLLRKAVAKMAEPPALPSAGAGVVGANQETPGNGLPGVAGAMPETAPEVIPWDPEQLRPLFDELIDGAEESRVEKFRSLAIEAKFPVKVIGEIAHDARYAPALKQTMKFTAPRVTAKAANRIGISGKYSDEGILLTCLVANFVQGRRLVSKLERLIEEQREKIPKDPNTQGPKP